MGSVRAKPEDNQKSPKKRKLATTQSAPAHPKVTGAQSGNARARAEQEAAEQSRQIASRQNRALKRSTPVSNSRRTQSKLVRSNLPIIKSTRITTVSFKRKVPKSGALKDVKQPSHLRAVPRPTKAAIGRSGKSRLQGRPTTPTRSSSEQQSHSEDDNSPNITPASLRSASKKSGLTSPAVRGRLSKTESVKSNPVQKRSLRTVQQRASKGSSEDSDAEMEDADRPAQARSRSTSRR
jgi:palmitoyltransferase ZDHHC9/14/18